MVPTNRGCGWWSTSGLRKQRATQLIERLGHPAVYNLGALRRLEE
jgi:hypothetical protein